MKNMTPEPMRRSRYALRMVLAVALVAIGWSGNAAQLDVEVVPRIGLFDPLLFIGGPVHESVTDRQNARLAEKALTDYLDGRNWRPLDYAQYVGALPERLRATLPQPRTTGGKKWDGFQLLVGFDQKMGYSQRTVIASLRDAPTGKMQDCRLASSTGKTWAMDKFYQTTDGCSIAIALDNNESQLSLSFVSAEPSAGATVTATVPADFLVVATGDSFASGEGNPDALWGNTPAILPRNADDQEKSCKPSLGAGFEEISEAILNSDDKTCAPLWMDQRCHRSAWSGPVQAALRFLKDDPKRRGAYTILNIACSGATVDVGLLGTYRDTPRTYRDLQKQFRARGVLAYQTQNDAVSRGALPTHSQVNETLANLFKHDHGGKQHVDLLTLSIGGNDIGFGDVITDLLSQDVAAGGRPGLRNRTRNGLDHLEYQGLPKLARELARFDIRQVLITEYPDPTRANAARSTEASCDSEAETQAQLAEFCAGPAMAGWASRKVVAVAGKYLSQSESRFSHCAVGAPLNARIKKAAGDNGWLFVSGIADAFVGRGWCGEVETNADFVDSIVSFFSAPSRPVLIEAFAERGRWFRRVDESYAFQGSKNGTMHPTWQGHGVYANRIAAEYQNTIPKKLDVRLVNETKARGATTFIGGPPEIMLFEGATAAAVKHHVCLATTDRLESCLPCFTSASGDLTPCLQGALLPTPLKTEASVRAMHNSTRAISTLPLKALMLPGTTALEVDNEAPLLASKFAGSGSEPCKSGWLTANCTLDATASDRGAGMGELTAEIRICSDNLANWEACTAPQAAPEFKASGGIDELRISVGAAGLNSAPYAQVRFSAADVFKLPHNKAVATQWVGIDTKPPVMEGLSIHDASVNNSGRSIPIVGRTALPVTVTLKDDVSGVFELALVNTALSSKPNITPLSGQTVTHVLTPFFPAPPVAGSRSQLILRASDAAGNAIEVAKIDVVSIPMNQRKSTSFTGAAVEAAERNRLLPTVQLLSSNSTSAPPGDSRWPLLSAWFNIAAGTVQPARAITHRLTSACTESDADLSDTLYAFLLQSEACITRGADAVVFRLAPKALGDQHEWRAQ